MSCRLRFVQCKKYTFILYLHTIIHPGCYWVYVQFDQNKDTETRGILILLGLI